MGLISNISLEINQNSDVRIGIKTTDLGLNFIPKRKKKATDLTHEHKDYDFVEKKALIDMENEPGLKGYKSSFINPEGEELTGKAMDISATQIKRDMFKGKLMDESEKGDIKDTVFGSGTDNISGNQTLIFEQKIGAETDNKQFRGNKELFTKENKNEQEYKGRQQAVFEKEMDYGDDFEKGGNTSKKTEFGSLADLIMGNESNEEGFKLNLFPSKKGVAGEAGGWDDFVIDIDRVDVFNDMISKFDDLKAADEEEDDLLDMMDNA